MGYLWTRSISFYCQRIFFNTSLPVIAYAIDDKKSFNSIEEWIRQCKQNSNNPEIKFFLVGNKNDIAPEK